MRVEHKCIIDALKHNEMDYLIHQVNCQGAFGSGLAYSIAKHFPEAKEEYQNYVQYEGKGKHLLGNVLNTQCGIWHLFGQLYYGRSGKVYTDYTAVKKGLDKIATVLGGTNSVVGIPYKMSCGLAGGDWGIISNIIEDAFRTTGCDIVIYKKEVGLV